MDLQDLAPIVIFVYNRPLHTRRTIDALLLNEYASESHLIIYSDGYKSESDKPGVESVRNYISSIKGFKSLRIIERDRNFGLGASIIDGVTSVVNEFNKIIVLEEDLLTSPYFLRYLNEGLKKYESVKNVISIHAYIYPIKKQLPETYFIRGADCWGWSTWKDKWNLFEQDGSKLLSVLEQNLLTSSFDFNGAYPYTQMLRDQIAGKNSSWAIRWYASAFIHNMLTLYPGKSLVYHIGNDGSGTNVGDTLVYDVKLADAPVLFKDFPISENKFVRNEIERFFKYNNAGILQILFLKILRILLTVKRKVKL